MLKRITRIAYKQAPEKGDTGDRGPQTRQLVWDAGIEFYCGAPGEKYADYAYYGGAMYECLKSHTSQAGATPYDAVANNTGYWRLVPSYENIATKVLLLGTGEEGWVMDEGVIKHTSGKISLSAAGQIIAGNGIFTVDKEGNMTAKSGTFGNLTIGTTAAGYPCLTGSVWYDSSEEHFIELSPEVFKLGARVDGEEIEAIDLMPYFYSDKYDRNDAFRIKMRKNSKMVIEGGMISGLRPQVVVSPKNRTTLGNYGGLAHPGVYVLTYTLDAFLDTLQTEDYSVGDCFLIINKNGNNVGVKNYTQPNIFNTLDNTSYGSGQTVQIPATTARSFHMVWTNSGFIIYK